MTGTHIPSMRAVVRTAFRKNQSVTDFKIAEMLRHKAEQVFLDPI
jgi:hypothetical protein